MLNIAFFLNDTGPQSTRIDNKPLPEIYYKHGPGDFLNVIFYAMVWIIIHALLQEYIWEVSENNIDITIFMTMIF